MCCWFLLVYLKISVIVFFILGFPGGSVGKESACNMEDMGLAPRLGRSPGGGHGNPLQYSCLENPVDSGGWWAAVLGLQRVGHDWMTKHSTQLSSSLFLLYIFSLLNFSLCSSILLLSLLSIFVIFTLNSLSGRLLISTLLTFFWGFVLFLTLDCIPLSPFFPLILSIISMYLVGQLYFQILEKWSYVGDILWYPLSSGHQRDML